MTGAQTPSTTSVYLDTIFGDRPGVACLAFGYEPYRDPQGKYRHRTWAESRFAWPAERVRLLADIDRTLVSDEVCDVYVCPALRHANAKSRRQGDALLPTILWADLDGPSADPALEETLDAFTVRSGQPGHRHLYVALAYPVDLRSWNVLQRALRDRLGGDDKIADNDLLRLPGTRNWKPTRPVPGQRATNPHPVFIERVGARAWTFEELAERFAIDEDAVDTGNRATPEVDAQPAPKPLPVLVRWALTHPDTGDRSAAHHRLVGACCDAQLTLGQTLTVVSGYGPSRSKFNGRLADEVARSWSKMRPVSATPTADSSEPQQPTPGAETPPTIRELIRQLSEWQDIPDAAHIYASIAVAVTAVDEEGEPAWLLLVAPPSSGKTETVRLLDTVAQERLDEVTIGGLLSWRPAGRGKPPKPSGVLSRVRYGLLTLGDLSTLLATSDRGGRDQVFALLRRVYDGNVSRDVGVPGGGGTPGPLSWEGRLTVVGAVTGAIDAYSTHADQLGSRWLYCRLHARDTAAKRRAADLARHGGLAERRKSARALAAEVAADARTRLDGARVTDDVAEVIEDSALVCCWGRATVPRHGYGRREIDGPVTVEEPMRVIRQLTTVARGLIALGCTTAMVNVVCRRLAVDSMPAARYAVLDVLSLRADNATTSKVAEAAEIDRSVARRALEDLEAVGVVRGHRQGPDPEDESRDWRPCTWRLADGDGDLIAEVFTIAAAEKEVLRNEGNTHTNPPK